MSTSLRQSRFRALGGAVALLVGLAILTFVLPDASDSVAKKRRARDQAKALKTQQDERLKSLQEDAGKLDRGQATLVALEARLPRGSAGDLQWKLSRSLHDLAAKDNVRLSTIKYSPPAKEGDLDAVEVEFTAVGIYAPLRSYLRSLEGSGLPFAVRDARLEESPEGARLTVVLRAFKPREGAKVEEEAS